jgi:hypothetical protein
VVIVVWVQLAAMQGFKRVQIAIQNILVDVVVGDALQKLVPLVRERLFREGIPRGGAATLRIEVFT